MIIDTLLSIIFPPRCAGCDCITSKDEPLCEDCNSLLLHPAHPVRRCRSCFLSTADCICKKHQLYSKISISFFYEGKPVKTVSKLKFKARPDIATNMAKVIFASLCERNMLKDTDIITFIPMSGSDRFIRGYNQAELIAKKLALLADKPCIPLLYKCIKTKSQHSLDRISRTGNLLGAFEPDKKYLNSIENKTILVVDDVSTTGNTFNEAAKTLLIFGANDIYAATLCSTKKRKKNH